MTDQLRSEAETTRDEALWVVIDVLHIKNTRRCFNLIDGLVRLSHGHSPYETCTTAKSFFKYLNETRGDAPMDTVLLKRGGACQMVVSADPREYIIFAPCSQTGEVHKQIKTLDICLNGLYHVGIVSVTPVLCDSVDMRGTFRVDADRRMVLPTSTRDLQYWSGAIKQAVANAFSGLYEPDDNIETYGALENEMTFLPVQTKIRHATPTVNVCIQVVYVGIVINPRTDFVDRMYVHKLNVIIGSDSPSSKHSNIFIGEVLMWANDVQTKGTTFITGEYFPANYSKKRPVDVWGTVGYAIVQALYHEFHGSLKCDDLVHRLPMMCTNFSVCGIDISKINTRSKFDCHFSSIDPATPLTFTCTKKTWHGFDNRQFENWNTLYTMRRSLCRTFCNNIVHSNIVTGMSPYRFVLGILRALTTNSNILTNTCSTNESWYLSTTKKIFWTFFNAPSYAIYVCGEVELDDDLGPRFWISIEMNPAHINEQCSKLRLSMDLIRIQVAVEDYRSLLFSGRDAYFFFDDLWKVPPLQIVNGALTNDHITVRMFVHCAMIIAAKNLPTMVDRPF